jgi:hypothetical protein
VSERLLTEAVRTLRRAGMGRREAWAAARALDGAGMLGWPIERMPVPPEAVSNTPTRH